MHSGVMCPSDSPTATPSRRTARLALEQIVRAACQSGCAYNAASNGENIIVGTEAQLLAFTEKVRDVRTLHMDQMLKGAQTRNRELVEEVRISDRLLDDRNRLLKLIPPCPEHGDECIPHAIDWVMDMKAQHDAKWTAMLKRR